MTLATVTHVGRLSTVRCVSIAGWLFFPTHWWLSSFAASGIIHCKAFVHVCRFMGIVQMIFVFSVMWAGYAVKHHTALRRLWCMSRPLLLDVVHQFTNIIYTHIYIYISLSLTLSFLFLFVISSSFLFERPWIWWVAAAPPSSYATQTSQAIRL